MNLILDIFKDHEIIIALITILPGMIGYLAKKTNEHNSRIRKEIIIKRSIMGDVCTDSIMLSLYQLLGSFFITLIGAAIITVFGIMQHVDPKVYIIFAMIASFVFSEVIPKISNNRKAFLSNLISDQKMVKLKNILIFYFFRYSFLVLLISVTLFDIANNFINTSIFFIVLLIMMLLPMRYFTAAVKKDRYSHVNIYFNNSYPVLNCPYKYFRMDDPSFISVKFRDNGAMDLINYNKNIVVKIDFILDEKIEENYASILRKKGFMR